MQRGDKTTLAALKQGDRFYKFGDKSKKVYQVVNDYSNVTGEFKMTCLPDGYHPRYPDKLNSTTEVIFLRHTE
jgi:hypothetical protein